MNVKLAKNIMAWWSFTESIDKLCFLSLHIDISPDLWKVVGPQSLVVDGSSVGEHYTCLFSFFMIAMLNVFIIKISFRHYLLCTGRNVKYKQGRGKLESKKLTPCATLTQLDLIAMILPSNLKPEVFSFF